MKALHVCLVALFCTVCLFVSPSHVLAAAEKSQGIPTVAADTPAPASAGLPAVKKTSSKAKKAIPTDVDINTADKTLLTALPNIGPVTADAIIAYRQTNGNFKSINELTKVKGIGEKTLAKLKPYLHEI